MANKNDSSGAKKSHAELTNVYYMLRDRDEKMHEQTAADDYDILVKTAQAKKKQDIPSREEFIERRMLGLRVAHACKDADEWIDFHVNGNPPLMKLTKREMELAQGGFDEAGGIGLAISFGLAKYWDR
jgi:hypothetical protein